MHITVQFAWNDGIADASFTMIFASFTYIQRLQYLLISLFQTKVAAKCCFDGKTASLSRSVNDHGHDIKMEYGHSAMDSATYIHCNQPSKQQKSILLLLQ